MILIIITVAAILRLVVIDQSLWLDEAINVNNAQALDFKSLVLSYSLSDFHPPLYHVILKLWIMFFGTSEISIRTPSILFGLSTVYATYLIGKKLFEEKTALIGATLMATAPLAIYYSQEARMYSLAAAAAAFSVYFFISLFKKDTIFLWLGLIASTAIMLYTDYLPYLLIPAYLLYLFLNKKTIRKATFRTFIPAFIIIFILLIPWMLLFPKQIQIGLSAAAASPAWAQVVGSPEAKSVALTFVKFTIGRISHDNNFLYVLIFAPIAVFVASLFALALLRLSRLRSFLWYWLFTTVILGFAISFFVPVFAYFRFLFVLPAFYLIAASGINTVNWPPLTRTFLGLFLLVNLASSYIYFTNPQFQRESWKDAAAYVVGSSTSQTIVLFESNYSIAPFEYYNRGQVPSYGGLDSFTPDQAKVKERLAVLTQNKTKVFLFQYLSGITDPGGMIFKELSNLGFANTSTKDFSGVGFVYEFTK